MRAHRQGIGLDITVREILDENMRVQDPERHRYLHEQAAIYYQNLLARTTGEEAWRIGLEWLYQLVKVNEKAGIAKCQAVADELVHYRRIDHLRELLNDASTYTLEQESNRLWLEYYKSRVSELEAEFSNTENILQNLVDDGNIKSQPREVSKDFVEYDVFISHAWEDKESFARPLAEALRRKRLKVWFDEFALRVGDGLRRSIDRGLANSRYGVVVLSPHFFAKEWPQKELDGLISRESFGQKVILPVWHNITADQVRKCSPTLADRIAVVSDKGIEHVVTELLRAMQTD